MNHRFVVLAISKKDVPIDNRLIETIKKKLQELKINPDDNFYFIDLYPKILGKENLNKLISLLQQSKINFNVKNDIDTPMNQIKSKDSSTSLIAIWNGKDEQIARLIITFRQNKKPVKFTIIDEKKASMWLYLGKYDIIFFSSNGYYVTRGKESYAVCGRGAALHARVMIPNLQQILGSKLKQFGNRIFIVGEKFNSKIASFPVKPYTIKVNVPELEIISYYANRYKKGDIVPGYLCKAQLDIICKSVQQLADLFKKQNINKVLLPRVGCGNGELDWFKDVLPIFKNEESIQPFLDRIDISTFSKPPQPITTWIKPSEVKKQEDEIEDIPF